MEWKLDRSLRHVAHDLPTPIAALLALEPGLKGCDVNTPRLLRGVIESLTRTADGLEQTSEEIIGEAVPVAEVLRATGVQVDQRRERAALAGPNSPMAAPARAANERDRVRRT